MEDVAETRTGLWIYLGVCVFIAGITVPLIFELVPPNPFYGFRIPKTLSDPAIWYAANRVGGIALLAGIAVSAVWVLGLLRAPDRTPLGRRPRRHWIALIGPLLLAVAVSFAYIAAL